MSDNPENSRPPNWNALRLMFSALDTIQQSVTTPATPSDPAAAAPAQPVPETAPEPAAGPSCPAPEPAQDLPKSIRDAENLPPPLCCDCSQEPYVKHVVENILSCMICHELIIDAYVLLCSHAFCESCIMDWVEVSHLTLRMDPRCPICVKIIQMRNFWMYTRSPAKAERPTFHTKARIVDDLITNYFELKCRGARAMRDTQVMRQRALMALRVRSPSMPNLRSATGWDCRDQRDSFKPIDDSSFRYSVRLQHTTGLIQ